MKLSTVTSIVVRVLKITGLSVAGILLLLFLAPILFPGTIEQKIKNFTNESIDGEINFSKVRLSFFNHFPSLTLTLHDFTLKGSAPFKKDTLVQAEKISFGINLKTLLFDKRVNISKIFVSDASIKILVNEKGEANYNVYVPAKKNTPAAAPDTAGTALKLEKIVIEHAHFIYNDRSVNILINAKGFNYTGNGDFTKAVFDLNSHANIDSMDFIFGGESYLVNKKVNADLITQINTNTFAFLFQKNDLRINKLPVQFSGKLNFLQNGYDLDLKVNADHCNLADLVTALPSQFITWQQKAAIKGNTDFLLTLKGKYIASSNTMPDLAFDMKIRDGFVNYEGAPFPASNLFLNLETSMPGVNPDSLRIKVDSIFFTIDKDYFSAVLNTKGVHEPFIGARINAQMDLEKLDKAFGFAAVDMKGKTDLHLTLNGRYTSGPNPTSLRHENIILTVPQYNLQASVKDGYFKYLALPIPVTNINFSVKSSCADNNYLNAGFVISDLNATAANSFIKGHASINSIKEKLVDAGLQADIALGDIKKIYPVEQLVRLDGHLKATFNTKGKYNPAKKLFPVTNADLRLQNGIIQTIYYPHPVSDVQVAANIINTSGALNGTGIVIQPASFQFEQQPFLLEATLKNLADIAYNIKAKGTIDIAKIYQVFAEKGTDVTGLIKADVALQGKQSDAMAGRYGRLNNAGTLQIHNIKASNEAFPQPFYISEGLFSFKQDKMWFKQFKASYGQSDFSMDGYLQNVIDYMLSDKAVLKGQFDIHSQLIDVDEFMVFAPVKKQPGESTVKTIAADKKPGGVVLVPTNLSLTATAAAKKVIYNGLNLSDAKGVVVVDKGRVSLQKTGFSLIGCSVVMDANYSSLSPQRALFDAHLQASDFDIKKAYNEVKLFHDMATAAGSAQGIVSLDYNLKGKLDDNMMPAYPSLEGGGILSVKDIHVKGFKLMSAVAGKTGKEGIKNPDLSKVDIKSTVKNNVITVEKFKIKTAGFRLRIEGKTNFDGAIKMKMRLGLPPLGIIGIPLQVTGTQTNPKVKIGKGDKDEVPETEDGGGDSDNKPVEKKN